MVIDETIQEMRKRIINLEGQVQFLYTHLGVTFVPDQSPLDDPRVIEEIKKGNILTAIKYYREVTNAGLVEAKRAVEAMQARLGI